MNRRELLTIKRAETMVAWFQAQPDNSTTLTDSEQATQFHAISAGEGWVHAGARSGDPRLVRAIRRWVDRQREGEFAEYTFGTKRAGRGLTFTNLRAGQARLLAATIGTTSQIQAAEQHERRIGEERGRIVLKLHAESEEWFQLGDFARAMCCRDAANDVDQFGYLRPATKQAFDRLGLRTVVANP